MKYVLLSVFLFFGCSEITQDYYYVEIVGNVDSVMPIINEEGTMERLIFNASVNNIGNSVSILTYVSIDTAELGQLEGYFGGYVFSNLGEQQVVGFIDIAKQEVINNFEILSFDFYSDQDLILKGWNGKPVSSFWSGN